MRILFLLAEDPLLGHELVVLPVKAHRLAPRVPHFVGA